MMKIQGEMQMIREWLQYVPQFSGKVFAFDIPWLKLSDIQKAELMSDITALQGVSVKLLLSVEPGASADLENWAIDFELKIASKQLESPSLILSVLNRGQAALVEKTTKEGLGASFCSMISEVGASKVIALYTGNASSKLDSCRSLSLERWRCSELAHSGEFIGVADLLDNGVPRVHLLQAGKMGVILKELFSSEGAGLMVYKNNYRQIRAIQSEDIPDLLVLIGRTVRNSKLVPRQYEDIEFRIRDYYVFEIDGNVIGCVALHLYQNNCAEVACLYVKQGHEGRGYGLDLVRHVERLAEQRGVTKLFALTTAASRFFSEKLGYKSMELDRIPAERFAQLQQSGRESAAFFKSFSKSVLDF